jgi:uncharacterized protein
MIRVLLLILLTMLLARALSRIIEGVLRGLSGEPEPSRGGKVPTRGVQMVRDPVCGTYVIPDRALALTHGSGHVYFCSTNCRDKYRPSGRTA